MKSIIISGISGFMGSNLKDYLNNNYTVHGLSRNANKTKAILNYDDVFKSGLSNHSAFIHLAGKAHDLKNTSDDSVYFQVNTDLTIKLFDMFLQSKCETFIFMSTVKAVADTVDTILTEQHKPNPKTAYGKSKRAAEEYLLSKNLPENKKVYILRPCMVHGPNNKGNLNLLFNIINKGIPYPLGKFDNKRSFLSIQNLCFVIQSLIELKPESGIYNVADDVAISTTKLVKTIGESINKKAKILNIPKLIIKSIARVGDIIKLPLTTEKLNKLTENYCVSNTKVKQAIQSELPIATIDGIDITIRSFKTNNANG